MAQTLQGLFDPNAASILRRNQQTPDQLYARHRANDPVRARVNTAKLRAVQDAFGRAGAESGRAYSVPSLNELQEGEMADIREAQLQAEIAADAKTAPETIRGMFGVEQERVKGSAAVEAAKMAAEAARATREAQEAGLESRSADANRTRLAVGSMANRGREQADKTRRDIAHAGITQRHQQSGRGRSWWQSIVGGAEPNPADELMLEGDQYDTGGGEIDMRMDELFERLSPEEREELRSLDLMYRGSR